MKSVSSGVLLAAALLAVGCAQTSEERTADTMTQAETPARGQGALATRGANLFVNAPNLTEEQKEQLLKIHGEAYQKAAKIRDELTQAKTALFKNLVSPTANPREVNALKKKIITLDKTRLDLMLKAFDDVQKVVGKTGLDESTMRHFIDMDSVTR